MSQTDFNDLHVDEGLPAVKAQIDAALQPGEAVPIPQGNADARSVIEGDAEADNGSSFFGDWAQELQRTNAGNIQANIFNTQLVLLHDTRWQSVIAYCDFSYRIVKRRAPPFEGGRPGEWEDADDDRLRIWLARHYGFTPRTQDAMGAVLVVAQHNRFHPVREYLQGLQWDQKPRLRSWLKNYMGVHATEGSEKHQQEYERYVSQAGTKWMVSAVARVMRPPVKADAVLILEGQQGLGKSTAIDILGGEWFSDTHFTLGDKDGYQQMQGVWLCELAELDSFNKAESTRSKQFFSAKEDRYRPSYGRRAVAFSRQCVFVGTTNQESYLKDATGNRRYWPVWCTKLEAHKLRRDRDQLWAEAFQLFTLDEPWWVEDHDKPLFEREQDQRFTTDVWEDKIVDFLHNSERIEPWYTTADIMEGALAMQPAQMKPPEQTRVGFIMRRLGWHKRKKTVEFNGQSMRKHVYEPPDDWEMSKKVSNVE